MSDQLQQLQPAAPQDVNIYAPYYKDVSKRNLLPLAISLYKKGSFEGRRTIEGGESISFVATWSVSTLPSDLTRCRLQFEGDADLSYEMGLTNNEFIEFLIEILVTFKQKKNVDFSQIFYRKLLRLDES
jgi:hypothetical protein